MVTMKAWLVVVTLTFLAFSRADENYIKYDAAARARFNDELRRLGVELPSYSVTDEPTERPTPVVSSPAGDFEGKWRLSRFGRPIATFEGIPYAQAPVGPLRFKEAQPLSRISTPLKATSLGQPCIQVASPINATLTLGDEDCLSINVYVPEKTNRSETEKLPVIFHVHGGAFIVGSGALMPPETLLEKDVVLVTFNYRLGVLGFLTTQDDTIPGNLGLKDQVAALKWTKENIASFGGNPNLITVFGISAGAASSEFLLISPLTRGLIQRMISASGSANAPWSTISSEEARANVHRAAELLGCPAEPSPDFLACVQTKTASEVTLIGTKYSKWRQTMSIPFRPIVEGDKPGALLPDLPERLFSSSNRSNDVPILTGTASEEGTLSGVLDIFNNPADLQKFDRDFVEVVPALVCQPVPTDEKTKAKYETLKRAYFGTGPLERRQELLATYLFTDLAFFWPALKTVESNVKGAKSPVYLYYFNFKGSRSLAFAATGKQRRELGVGHGDDAVYLIPLPGPVTPQDVAMSIIYTDFYANFARDGVPSSTLVNLAWSPVTSETTDMPYLHIKSPSDITLKKNLLPERWNLIKALFDKN